MARCWARQFSGVTKINLKVSHCHFLKVSDSVRGRFMGLDLFWEGLLADDEVLEAVKWRWGIKSAKYSPTLSLLNVFYCFTQLELLKLSYVYMLVKCLPSKHTEYDRPDMSSFTLTKTKNDQLSAGAGNWSSPSPYAAIVPHKYMMLWQTSLY